MERLGGDALGEGELAARLRTATGSSTASTTMATGASMGSGGPLASTAFTTPDLGTANAGAAVTEAGEATALMPVTALPASEVETQVSMAKIAESDVDAFMAYVAIVPEYCHLEGMLVQ